jgi:hypothetical protein
MNRTNHAHFGCQRPCNQEGSGAEKIVKMDVVDNLHLDAS